MDAQEKKEWGSKTAKSGFINEENICTKFNDWQYDSLVQSWLSCMGYDVNRISYLKAVQVPLRLTAESIKRDEIHISSNKALDFESFFKELNKYKKADAQVNILIKIDNLVFYENISLKRKSTANYNQIDKRWVAAYKEMWAFDAEMERYLKLMTGELLPADFGIKSKHQNRLLLKEMPENVLDNIIEFFSNNKFLVLSDTLRGRGCLCAEWMIVTDDKTSVPKYSIQNMSKVINYMSQGEVVVSKTGSTLNIGRVVMQRKGGTPDPIKLQFKFHPGDVFNIA